MASSRTSAAWAVVTEYGSTRPPIAARNALGETSSGARKPCRRQSRDAHHEPLGGCAGLLDHQPELAEAVGGEEMDAPSQHRAQIAQQPGSVQVEIPAEEDTVGSRALDPPSQPQVARARGSPTARSRRSRLPSLRAAACGPSRRRRRRTARRRPGRTGSSLPAASPSPRRRRPGRRRRPPRGRSCGPRSGSTSPARPASAPGPPRVRPTAVAEPLIIASGPSRAPPRIGIWNAAQLE